MNRLPRFLKLSLACAVALAISGAARYAAALDPHGVAVDNLDQSVKPGDDFYRYANGGWLKRAEIPPDRAGVDVWTRLTDMSNKRLADLIAEIAKSNPPAGSSSRKVADLYNSYMDEAGIEAKGLAPVRPHLEAIAAIHDKKELAHALGETLRADVDALNNTNYHTPNLFGMWVAPSFNDSDHYIAYLMQGGLQLPDREYYLSDSQHMRDIRTKYQAHVANLLKLAGLSEPEARAARILELETAIAKIHRSLADDQDISKANNPWTQGDFRTKAPGLDWDEYFRGAGLTHVENFIVWQPDAFTAEAALVESQSLDSWKDLLTFHVVEAYAGALPKALAAERFSFFGKELSGAQQQRPRWERGVFVVDGLLGDAVGQVYAQRYFSPESKAQIETMVANMIAAFRKRIEALSWMDPSTKAEAEAKLSTLYVGIGYPETWHDYSNYEVKADDLFGNLWRGDLSEYQRQVARLGKSVDRKEWSMTPQTVNAVNLPLQNALNFPAAIFQPPFFDPKAPNAFNYGAVGSVIGHEISHTFDTEGSAFDSKGRVRNWWTPEDLKHFAASTEKLAAQYDTYKPFPDLALNGKQTLAENIADVAGISAAYDGYHASLAGKPAPMQDGLNGDQQFFIAFAQNWGEKVRDAALRQQVLTDEHSPGEYRSCEVRNIDPWYAAFEVKPGEKLYLEPGERVKIW
jgi:endothelin-converting enzyme/putative endopeptidase